MRRIVVLSISAVVVGALVVQMQVPGLAVAPGSAGSIEPGWMRRTTGGTHVAVHDQYFSPTTVPVPRGGTVVFDFVGEGHHTATDDSGLDLYDSGLVDGGGPSLSVDFPAAGAYRFTCAPHPSMGGRVEVPVRVSPRKGDLGERFTVTWASIPPPEGLVQDVQIRRPGGTWKIWRDGVAGTSRVFRADAGAGVYRFRARLRDGARNAAFWSPEATASVTR